MTYCYIPLVQWADSPQALVSLRFQSALLHSFIDNTLNLSTPVIGSYENWGIPPGLIVQYFIITPFTSG